MKTFNQFITEARRNPELNVKQFPVKALEKYKDDEDIFITFIQNAEAFTETGKSGELTAQVGLNTKSRYNTPNGVYTYPMVEVYKNYVPGKLWRKFNVPFGGDMPKIGVLRRVGKNFINDVGTDEYTEEKLASDTEKIVKYTMNKLMKILDVKNEYLIFLIVCSTVQFAFKGATKKTPGMQFWNASRLCASLIALAHEEKKLTVNISDSGDKKNQRKFPIIRLGKDMPRMSAWWVYGKKEDLGKDFDLDTPKKVPADLLTKIYDTVQKMKDDKKALTTANIFNPSGDKKEKGKGNPYANAWAVLLIRIGYDSIADRDGNRVIHQAEPIQAVFLRRRGYKVLDIIENKSYGNRKPVFQQYREKKTDVEKAKFLQKMENYGISQDEENVRLWRFFEKLKSNSIIVSAKVLTILAKEEPQTVVEFYRTGHSNKVINDLMEIALKEKAETLNVYLSRGPECKISSETIIFGLEELLRQKKERNPKSINSPLLDIRTALRLYENKWKKQDEKVIQAFKAVTQKVEKEAQEYMDSQ